MNSASFRVGAWEDALLQEGKRLADNAKVDERWEQVQALLTSFMNGARTPPAEAPAILAAPLPAVPAGQVQVAAQVSACWEGRLQFVCEGGQAAGRHCA
jgi:hypothetical protein